MYMVLHDARRHGGAAVAAVPTVVMLTGGGYAEEYMNMSGAIREPACVMDGAIREPVNNNAHGKGSDGKGVAWIPRRRG